MRVDTKSGLLKLKGRYLAAGVQDKDYGEGKGYWIRVIDGCIKDSLAMDEDDYANTPKELKSLWRGCK